MRYGMPVLLALVGLGVGILGTLVFAAPYPPELLHRHHQTVVASSNDRYQDFIMCTGAVAITARSPSDGVWMLDYKSGKLLATVIDRTRPLETPTPPDRALARHRCHDRAHATLTPSLEGRTLGVPALHGTSR